MLPCKVFELFPFIHQVIFSPTVTLCLNGYFHPLLICVLMENLKITSSGHQTQSSWWLMLACLSHFNSTQPPSCYPNLKFPPPVTDRDGHEFKLCVTSWTLHVLFSTLVINHVSHMVSWHHVHVTCSKSWLADYPKRQISAFFSMACLCSRTLTLSYACVCLSSCCTSLKPVNSIEAQ